MISSLEILGLGAAAALAGAINAVAGGGTLVTFPTLLAFGTPPVIANATSTVALVLGTAGSLFGYRRHIESVRPLLRRFVPVSIIGGLLGSVLLTRTTNETFARLVPFLILFATLLFLGQGALRRVAGIGSAGELRPKYHALWGAVIFQFAVAVYGGYFGAGMLASLGCIGLSNIHEMNVLKTILGAVINIVAAAWFVHAGLVDWMKAGVMTSGALGGYFLGAHFSQRIPQARVRQLVTAIGFTLSAVTFYKQFLR
jgi:hypothetical protein